MMTKKRVVSILNNMKDTIINFYHDTDTINDTIIKI